MVYEIDNVRWYFTIAFKRPAIASLDGINDTYDN